MRMKGNEMKKDWGTGIPVYNKDDELTRGELFEMAVNLVIDEEVNAKGYELVATSYEEESIPNIVFRKEAEGRLMMIDVEAAVSPNYVGMDNQLHGIMLDQAKKFDARAYFASVSFGSRDKDRFNASLLLRGDDYNIRYEGLQKIIRPVF